MEMLPENIPLTRAWLLKYEWKPVNDYYMFEGNNDYIDADLCVVANRKEYMIAKFHYMGDKAWELSAMPDSFEIVGVNNNIELSEYDFTRFILSVFVCHLMGLEIIEHSIGCSHDKD